MRITRKTAAALAVSGAITVGAALVAAAAVFSFPVFGFGPAASTSAQPPPTSVVERTVYDDHYVTRAPAGGNAGAGGSPASTGSRGAPAVPVAATTGSGTGTAQPASAVVAPSPTTTRPPIPAGCQEPEWEPQDGGWHCKGD